MQIAAWQQFAPVLPPYPKVSNESEN